MQGYGSPDTFVTATACGKSGRYKSGHYFAETMLLADFMLETFSLRSSGVFLFWCASMRRNVVQELQCLEYVGSLVEHHHSNFVLIDTPSVSSAPETGQLISRFTACMIRSKPSSDCDTL